MRPAPRTVLRTDASGGTPALVMRPWREADGPALLEVYDGDPLLRRFTRVPVDSDEDATRWLEVRRQGWADGSYLGFAAFEAEHDGSEGPLVGNVVLKRPEPDGPSAEVGYWTAARARGRGIAPKAVEALTVWAFESYTAHGLERLELLHQVDNLASCRVARKCGYLYEATLPACPPFPLDGHLHVRRSS